METLDNTVTSQRITALISEWVRLAMDDYCLSDINELVREGYCADLATWVWEELGKPRTEVLSFGNSDNPEHTWLIFEGKHYDMQCPQGVDSKELMPYFQN